MIDVFYTSVYKCRMCGEIINTTDEIKLDFIDESPEKLAHPCGGGKLGIAELIGYKRVTRFSEEEGISLDEYLHED